MPQMFPVHFLVLFLLVYFMLMILIISVFWMFFSVLHKKDNYLSYKKTEFLESW